MKIVPRKYNFIALAAILVVALGIMAFSLRPMVAQKEPTPQDIEISQIQTQSSSDETAAIERDLDETDLSSLDKELQDIDKELDASY